MQTAIIYGALCMTVLIAVDPLFHGGNLRLRDDVAIFYYFNNGDRIKLIAFASFLCILPMVTGLDTALDVILLLKASLDCYLTFFNSTHYQKPVFMQIAAVCPVTGIAN